MDGLTIQEQLLGPEMLKYRSLLEFFSGMLSANLTLVSTATKADDGDDVNTTFTIENSIDTFEKNVSDNHPMMYARCVIRRLDPWTGTPEDRR